MGIYLKSYSDCYYFLQEGRMPTSLTNLPSDVWREIALFLPPYDFVALSTVSMCVRLKIGIDVEQVKLGHKIIDTVCSIIHENCPALQPGSTFVIAGSFAAFLGAMHLGIPKSHVHFVFNDIDVFYLPKYDQVDDSNDQFGHTYAHTQREDIIIDDQRFEVNWVPGPFFGDGFRPFVRVPGEPRPRLIWHPFDAKDVVRTFDLSCVRVGFQVSTVDFSKLLYICPSFYKFVKTKVITVEHPPKSAYARRSTAIRMCYKAMVLKVNFNTEPLNCLLGKRRTKLQDGEISESNAKKLIALQRNNPFVMPDWLQGLHLVITNLEGKRVYFLEKTDQSCLWGAISSMANAEKT